MEEEKAKKKKRRESIDKTKPKAKSPDKDTDKDKRETKAKLDKESSKSKQDSEKSNKDESKSADNSEKKEKSKHNSDESKPKTERKKRKLLSSDESEGEKSSEESKAKSDERHPSKDTCDGDRVTQNDKPVDGDDVVVSRKRVSVLHDSDFEDEASDVENSPKEDEKCSPKADTGEEKMEISSPKPTDVTKVRINFVILKNCKKRKDTHQKCLKLSSITASKDTQQADQH